MFQDNLKDWNLKKNLLLTRFTRDIIRGDIGTGGFCPGGFCPGGILYEGILSGGYCPGGYCPDTLLVAHWATYPYLSSPTICQDPLYLWQWHENSAFKISEGVSPSNVLSLLSSLSIRSINELNSSSYYISYFNWLKALIRNFLCAT